MTARPKTSGKQAAAEVLRAARGPLHIREITERVLRDYRTGLKGATPQATLGAQLHTAAVKKDTFKKVAPATFDLIDRAAKSEPKARKKAPARAASRPQARTDFKSGTARKSAKRRTARR